jgi:hypothetical protein
MRMELWTRPTRVGASNVPAIFGAMVGILRESVARARVRTAMNFASSLAKDGWPSVAQVSDRKVHLRSRDSSRATVDTLRDRRLRLSGSWLGTFASLRAKGGGPDRCELEPTDQLVAAD